MVDNIVLQNQTLQIENLCLFVLAELHFFCLVFAHISIIIVWIESCSQGSTGLINTECSDSFSMAWNPFSSGKLGPDACSACDSAMSKVLLFQRGWFESSPKSDFMRVIMLNIKQRPVERFASLSSRYLSYLLSFSHQPFSCSPPLLCSKHSPPLCPSSWKVWFMDVWSMSAKK